MANKGKFINTTHTDNINTLVDNVKTIINNPYYVWANSKPTIVDYYNMNRKMSTLDEGFKNINSDLGKDSPIWFNIVRDFYLYGIERIQIQIEDGEFGAESGDISGEAFILPNTIIPYAGDMFVIKYIKEKFFFRVTGVSHDTLENGSNMYKITYKLESSENHLKDIRIKDRYRMVVNNIGTDFNAVIREESYDLIERLEALLYKLKTYYTNIFYSSRVQAFIYKFNHKRFYDPYMTEFLMNNSLLSGAEDYVYITQQLPLRSNFPVQYDRSFFRCLELEDFKHMRKYTYKGIGRYIDNDLTIFGTRMEDYFEMDYSFTQAEGGLHGVLQCFREELFEGIESGKTYDGNDAIYNIIIKYATGQDIDDQDVEFIDFDIYNNITLFYAIPCIIFCLEGSIKRMMAKIDQD